MIVYSRLYNGDSNWETISYDEALKTVLTTFDDCDLVRDMLTVPNWITCRLAVIGVKVDGRVLMPGLAFAVPDGCEYDEKGNRLP